MAFAAVLTALGYYIILRRFCQGLLKFFFRAQLRGRKFSLFAACQPPPLAYFPALPPPAGNGSGRSRRRPKPPRLSRVPLTPAEPARQGKPLRQRVIRPCSGAARVQPRGCKGRSPLHEITLVSPFPTGEGGWGDRGQENKLKGGRQTAKKASPRSTCSICPGGEDHLKRRRRVRRIVPSPPVPPLLGCRHCQ